jgi:hypothetical protein
MRAIKTGSCSSDSSTWYVMKHSMYLAVLHSSYTPSLAVQARTPFVRWRAALVS